MNDISTALTVLSAMITPAVLILASGSLILTTSQRLGRALERTRKIYVQFELLKEKGSVHPGAKSKYVLLKSQIRTITQRAHLLQLAMAYLHITLGIFVATSISIGIIALIGMKYSWIPTTLGMLGVATLFYSTIFLIQESRIALQAIKQEMNYANEICEADIN